MRRNKFAIVKWSPEDILALAKEKGIKISKRDARAFLDQYERQIEEAMIATGWDVIRNCFDEDYENNGGEEESD